MRREVEDEAPEFTILSSDDTDASVFNLRGRLFLTEDEWSEGERSLISSDNEDVEAERERVAQWRQAEDLQEDRDFAFVYVTFEEAYQVAGRAVAMAWSRCRQRVEPTLAAMAGRLRRTSESIDNKD